MGTSISFTSEISKRSPTPLFWKSSRCVNLLSCNYAFFLSRKASIQFFNNLRGIDFMQFAWSAAALVPEQRDPRWPIYSPTSAFFSLLFLSSSSRLLTLPPSNLSAPHHPCSTLPIYQGEMWFGNDPWLISRFQVPMDPFPQASKRGDCHRNESVLRQI